MGFPADHHCNPATDRWRDVWSLPVEREDRTGDKLLFQSETEYSVRNNEGRDLIGCDIIGILETYFIYIYIYYTLLFKSLGLVQFLMF